VVVLGIGCAENQGYCLFFFDDLLELVDCRVVGQLMVVAVFKFFPLGSVV